MPQMPEEMRATSQNGVCSCFQHHATHRADLNEQRKNDSRGYASELSVTTSRSGYLNLLMEADSWFSKSPDISRQHSILLQDG